ncbi:Mg-chelatase subunit ChlI [Archaeoglobus sulfaticallidus PM70-1]|uniref:Mg-chelatase subunit ChlI n=1 Tax=Archaeoglobus sulfaticallidus PM70-1 TaxID=387631 RepID=N0BAB0_9EURY|nr:AAA family ATPase [Archaeoglobus sulfaticallidus]AGK60519.1 Mg-chelatase subunit ChlI [Archaeoglobus sulfaticallidus PM70-1]
MDDVLFEEVVVKESSSPKYLLNGEEVDIWDSDLREYHSKSVAEYIAEKLLELEKNGIDPFPEIVGKDMEKEMVKNALLSGSNILFKGMKGFGKTTFSKSISKLLPERILAIKGCKIHDDPARPVCFSCKKKVLEDNEVELTWVGRKWVRILGDPMMTTRQLIGGISIQKLREGYDIDSPEVFSPGRILKANRGIAYVDELGAIPSAMQTLLHELLEERQVTTPEGDIIPMRIDTLFIASTNPANYRGTADIKEPLLDRMEEIFIGEPETIEEEIEIGLRNMRLKGRARIPEWHLRCVARIVRIARKKEGKFSRIEVEPSCRATIKIFDHLVSSAIRNGRDVTMLEDYGVNYANIKLGLRSRIELDYDSGNEKDNIIEALVEEALNKTAIEVYSKIPKENFNDFVKELSEIGTLDVSEVDGEYLKVYPNLMDVVRRIAKDDAELVSTTEIILESLRRCTGILSKVACGKYEYTGEMRR